jgi:hypothetical protein
MVQFANEIRQKKIFARTTNVANRTLEKVKNIIVVAVAIATHKMAHSRNRYNVPNVLADT